MGTAYDDVTDAGRLAYVVTAVTEATELAVSENPHLPGDPTIAVLAVGMATKKTHSQILAVHVRVPGTRASRTGCSLGSVSE